MNFFTRSISRLSIQTAIPILFIVTLLFLYVQVYHIFLPSSISQQTQKAHAHLQGILAHSQASLSELLKSDLVSAIRQEIKLQPVRDKQIQFAVIFDDNKHILYLSNRNMRAFIDEHINHIMNDPSFFDADQYQKPYIFTDDQPYSLHGVVPVELPTGRVDNLAHMEHGHLMVVYSYADEIDDLMQYAHTFFFISVSFAIVIFFLFSYFLHVFVLTKMRQLAMASENIKSGDFSKKLVPEGFKEVQDIIHSFNNMSLKIASDIQNINTTKMELLKEKETAQNYLDIVGVMILVLDADFNVKLINQRGCEIMGYQSDEMIGKNWIEHFLPERLRKKIVNVGNSLTNINRASIQYYENPVLTKSGDERLIAWRNTTLFDDDGQPVGILTSGEDITDIRAAEQQLKQSEHFFRNIFASVNEAIFILYDNIIVDCNEKMCDIVEVTKERLVGSDLYNFCNIQCKHNTFNEYVNKAIDGNTVSTKCFISLDNDQDRIKIVQMTMTPMGDDLGKVVCVMRDITQELEKDKLLLMNSRQAQMGEMISMIAHQWRQPLAAISAITTKMTLNNVMNDIQDDELIQNLQKIEHQVTHLSQTITDFRDFFKPNKPKERIRLTQLVHDTLELLDHALKSSAIQITINTSADVTVATYRNEVLQVLMTLMKNSLDAFQDNQIKTRKLTFDISVSEKYGSITLTDNAGGISPSIISDIFLPYFTTKDDKHGTGLGLYMSKTVIEDHCRGQLNVSSSGEETQFTVSLPLDQETRDD